jgi:dihydrofolate synthase/folylpolyglutamate synthase
MDHMDFLGETLDAIAFEKAGIVKPGVPCATGLQDPAAAAVIARVAAERGAPLLARGRGWTCEPVPGGLRYADARGAIDLPPPGLPGPHQADNAGIAIAALRAWNPPWLTDAATARGVGAAEWPARLQRLSGALAEMLPPGFELWLDGGHNAGAGVALAQHLPSWGDRPLHLVVGMKKGKASVEFLRPLLPFATTLTAVAEPGQHLAMPVEDIVAASGGVARPGPTVAAALARIAAEGAPGRVLVCGSLYLAGEVLKAEAPAELMAAGA